tara:strand:+ start:5977 stop:7254 length:1278 start_codon:yes stop_codon:yes gene_type:complete
MTEPQIIDIASTFNEPSSNSTINLNLNNEPNNPTSLPGADLLMNEKRKENSSTPNINLKVDQLENLENDLNNLSSGAFKEEPINESNNVNFGKSPRSISSTEIKFDSNINDNTTWDGYSAVNDPPNPDIPVYENKTNSVQDEIKQKFYYLRKLEDLEAKGITLTKRYSMDSNLLEMQGEYENIMAEKEKSNSMKFQGKMLMACITGLEFLNNKFDPFDLKLEGWSEQVNENLEDYDEIFAQLHQKYKSKASLAPELKLLFQLGGSAIMLHMTNTMFKSSLPGMDDILKQNPELMQKFTQAAVGSMESQNPGFGGFMNSVQSNYSDSKRSNVPQQSRRNDLNYNVSSSNSVRPEMSGPSDISHILKGLKTKNSNKNDSSGVDDLETGSVVSLSDLKETDVKLNTKNFKSKRSSSNKSDKNSINLNL